MLITILITIFCIWILLGVAEVLFFYWLWVKRGGKRDRQGNDNETSG